MKEKVVEFVRKECAGNLKYKGFRYLCSAIELVIENDMYMPMMDIYDRVAEIHNVTARSVERDIRYIVAKIWKGHITVSSAVYEFAYKIANEMR